MWMRRAVVLLTLVALFAGIRVFYQSRVWESLVPTSLLMEWHTSEYWANIELTRRLANGLLTTDERDTFLRQMVVLTIENDDTHPSALPFVPKRGFKRMGANPNYSFMADPEMYTEYWVDDRRVEELPHLSNRGSDRYSLSEGHLLSPECFVNKSQFTLRVRCCVNVIFDKTPKSAAFTERIVEMHANKTIKLITLDPTTD